MGEGPIIHFPLEPLAVLTHTKGQQLVSAQGCSQAFKVCSKILESKEAPKRNLDYNLANE